LLDDEADAPPWMLAELDKGIADVEVGKVSSFEQYRAEIREHRAKWLTDQS
jgi:hypothetical protein